MSTRDCLEHISPIPAAGPATARQTKTMRSEPAPRPARELHPAGLQVVDMQDFRFLINPDICGQHRIRLVTIVNSAIPNKVGFLPDLGYGLRNLAVCVVYRGT